MDVQRSNFPAKLLDMIEAVSESCFIAFDLELSGVPVRPFGARESGKATLQERYTETKAAADKYQILQVGITCVKEDVVDATYELKTFNIDLSPVLSERLDIDRTFSFHSGAVEFLNSVGFNFNTPLTQGVSYLSRDEAELALRRADHRLSRNSDFFDPLNIKPEETESLKLLECVRKEVNAWIKATPTEPYPLFLGPKELGSKGSGTDELSKFEKRLVHQIVRQEYPHLVTIPRRGIISVQLLDIEREASIKKSKLRDTVERIKRQTGLRWVIEAISGRDISSINAHYFTTDPETGATHEPSFDTQARFSRSQHHLWQKPRPVVGHNMFLDLVYLYRTFVGELPDHVEDFAAAVHELFPVIVDTKYLATHECGDINPMSSLQQLAEQMTQRDQPSMSIHPRYNKYTNFEAHHEAGYDSLLTAKVAIRLSAMLEAQARSLEDQGSPDPEEDAVGGVALQSNGHGNESAGTLAAATEALKRTCIDPAKEPVKSMTPASNGIANEPFRFAHATAFDSLQEDDGNESDGNDLMHFEDLPSESNDADTTGPWPIKVHNWEEWAPLRLMPRWGSGFWEEYGNRLRVFGTQEGMCILDASAP